MDTIVYERQKWEKGLQLVAGIDECGRGCFAGPVVAAAVILPISQEFEKDYPALAGLTDSKKLSKKKHRHFAEKVKEVAITWAIGVASVEEVDEVNIKEASRLAMKRAVEGLESTPDYLLIDGTEIVYLPIQQESIIKGDSKSLSIAAASVIAKAYRDDYMTILDEQYGSRYGWKSNAGYQAKAHLDACERYGITEHHRKTWKTMEKLKKHD